MAGIFYGVGVGPGDPELLTLKAINLIKSADIIIAPKTEKKEGSVALTIAKPYIKDTAEIATLVFPMVSDQIQLNDAWASNKETIVNYLDEGKTVVFLTLGDPMFYSTYIYVYRLLKDCGHPIETIPGITAFCAIGSKLGYPIVEGDDVLNIIPATMEEEKMEQAFATADNVVLMKVYKNFPQVLEKLKRHGLAKQAVMISRCGLDGEQVVHNLSDLNDDHKLNYLSTIVARRG
ncbi:MAG: precorrin-2 C(20)-methyltransferase [Sporomusaceae bacterium]|nr:precorrin-2 C(20)-methyltransferase [Sporomusaceae bacterium]